MLKLLACLFMLLDHIGYYFHDALPGPLVLVLRGLGRLAFPIFAWSVARGFSRTHNPLVYFVRIAVFAVLTEAAFRFMHARAGLTVSSTNVLVTFALAIVLLSGYRLACHASKDMIASLRPISPTAHPLSPENRFDVRINIGGIELDRRLGLALGLLMMFLAMVAAIFLKPDYGIYGLLTVLLFYAVHDHYPEKLWERRAVQGFVILNILFMIIRIATRETSVDWAILQCLSIAALPFCYALDRNRKPKRLTKYAFYLFYPAHIVILLAIRILFFPG